MIDNHLLLISICCKYCIDFPATQNCSVTKVTGKINHNRNKQRTRLRFSSDGGPGVTYKCKFNDESFEDCELIIYD